MPVDWYLGNLGNLLCGRLCTLFRLGMSVFAPLIPLPFLYTPYILLFLSIFFLSAGRSKLLLVVGLTDENQAYPVVALTVGTNKIEPRVFPRLVMSAHTFSFFFKLEGSSGLETTICVLLFYHFVC